MKIPNRFPSAPFRIAHATSPPDDLVSTVTNVFVIGNEAPITIPSAKSMLIISNLIRNLDIPYTRTGTNPRLNN